MNENQQRFRFLDLPVEIQRLIFEKCYAEPWKVVGRLMKPLGQHFEYEFTSPFSSLPNVSKHLSRETKRAVRLSESGSYRGFVSSTRASIDLRRTSASFDLGIVSAELDIFQLLHLSKLKQRFPNIKQVHVLCDLASFFGHTRKLLRLCPLLDVLTGIYDDQAAAAGSLDFGNYLASYGPGAMVSSTERQAPCDIYGIKVEGKFSLPATCLQLPEGAYYELKGQKLCIDFEMSDSGCRLLRKWVEVDSDKSIGASHGVIDRTTPEITSMGTENTIWWLQEAFQRSGGRMSLHQDYF